MLKLENYMDLLELGNILVSNAVGRTQGFPEFDNVARRFITRYQALLSEHLVSGLETVASKELAALREDSEMLLALQDAGVDNWEGYSIACRAVLRGDDDDDDE